MIAWQHLKSDNERVTEELASIYPGYVRHISRISTAYQQLDELYPIYNFQGKGIEHGVLVASGQGDAKKLKGWVKPEGMIAHTLEINFENDRPSLPLYVQTLIEEQIQAALADKVIPYEVADYRSLARVYGIAGDTFSVIIGRRVKAVLDYLEEGLKQTNEPSGVKSQLILDAARAMAEMEKDMIAPAKKVAAYVPKDVFANSHVASKYDNYMFYFYSHEGEIGQLRRETMQAYPILAEILPNDPLLQQYVHNKQSIRPYLTDNLGIGKAAIKRVGKIGWPLGDTDAAVVLKKLASIDGNQAPQDEKNWEAFLEVVRVIDTYLSPATHQEPLSLMKGFKGNKWIDHALKLHKQAGVVDDGGKPSISNIGIGSIENIARSATDMVEGFSNRVLLPIIMHGARENGRISLSIENAILLNKTSACLLFDGKNASAVLDLVKRFHHQFEALTGSALERDISDVMTEWPPLCDDVITPEGFHLKNLTSAAELVEEGRKMNHCVGMYDRNCATGISRIMSVQDPAGKTLSTAEFIHLDSMDNIKTRQNLAYKNWNPEPEAQKAVNWFLSQVREERIVINTDLIADHASKARSFNRFNSVSMICGYDCERPDLIRASANSWTDLVKNNSFDSLLRDQRVKKMISAINPYTDIEKNLSKAGLVPTSTQTISFVQQQR